MSSPRQVRQVVGQRVRELREQAGIRQEDLAAEARHLGLAWSRSRIAALERGEKPIAVEDLILLVGILNTAMGRRVEVADLFDADDSVSLSKIAEIPARHIAEVLRGDWSAPAVLVRDDQRESATRFSDAAYKRHQAIVELQSSSSASGDWTEPRVRDFEGIQKSMGEADERAQRALGEELSVYVSMCWGLWGRSLSAERDARLRTDAEVSPASLAARRGRVTRELLAELRQLQAKITTAED